MRLHTTRQPSVRAGLTLVEMLIALALSIFIMAILSEAFVKGLETFGQYKALADLEQRLRTFANILRRDLRAPHFENSKKLSECTASNKPMPTLDGLKAGTFTTAEALVLHQQLAQYRMVSPAQGFFSIEEWANRPGSPPGPATDRVTAIFEGQDSNSGKPSYRDQYDVIHFTSRLEGNDPSSFFYGKVRPGSPVDGIGKLGGQTRYDIPGNSIYTSQAAELLYLLFNDDTVNLPGAGSPGGPIRTFNLHRQAWLLVPDQFSNGDPVVGGIPSATPIFDTVVANFFDNNDLSAALDTIGGTPAMLLNTLSDVQHVVRRRGTGTVRLPRFNTTTGTADGSDIMLTNVISFDVKVFDPFAYKIPLGAVGGGPASGRGAYVDIGDVYDNVANTFASPYSAGAPTAASAAGDALTPAFGGPVSTLPYVDPITGISVSDRFDTGTSRLEGTPGGANLSPAAPTHRYPFTSIQITIRVYEPKSKQTRQITIIQDM